MNFSPAVTELVLLDDIAALVAASAVLRRAELTRGPDGAVAEATGVVAVRARLRAAVDVAEKGRRSSRRSPALARALELARRALELA